MTPPKPSQYVHTEDPHLISELKVLPCDLQTQIKKGFYELKPLFFTSPNKEQQIYINHTVLHSKHPVFCKL